MYHLTPGDDCLSRIVQHETFKRRYPDGYVLTIYISDALYEMLYSQDRSIAYAILEEQLK